MFIFSYILKCIIYIIIKSNNIGQLIVQGIMQNNPDLHIWTFSRCSAIACVAILHIFKLLRRHLPNTLLACFLRCNISPLAVQQENLSHVLSIKTWYSSHSCALVTCSAYSALKKLFALQCASCLHQSSPVF